MKLALAPMAGYTCTAFRIQCRKYGAALTFTQMLDCKKYLENPDKWNDYSELDKPCYAQIIGNDPGLMARAAKKLEKIYDGIDINSGCIETKKTREGQGCALMDKPELIKEIISEIKKVTKKPVTIKIRKHKNSLLIAKLAEQAGASMITVHARDYSNKLDWSIIKKIKENVKIPVIGNGGISKPQDAKRMLEETGCDHIMIGKASLGNPAIFKDTLEYLTTGKMPVKQRMKEKLKKYLEFTELFEKYQKRQSLDELKTHAYVFIKGIKGREKLELDIKKAINEKELTKIIKNKILELSTYESK